MLILFIMLKTYMCQETFFSCFDGASDFSAKNYVFVNVSSSWLGIVFSLCFCRVLVTSLHSSLNHVVLSFKGLYLLLGIVLFAMVHRASVKIPVGSAALTIQSAFKSEAALSKNMFQSALLSYQVMLVTDGTAMSESIIIDFYWEMITATEIVVNLPREV